MFLHPQNIMQVASLAYDNISHGNNLRKLYNNDNFRRFLRRILDLPVLYRLADPLGACSINIFKPGKQPNRGIVMKLVKYLSIQRVYINQLHRFRNLRLVSRVALWRIKFFYNLDAAKSRDGRWFSAHTAHKSRSWCSRETKRGKQFYLGQQWNRIQVFLIPIYQHCLQLCPNEIVSENWHYEMMENLVGPDGSSGGDEPPKMAKTLVFEPGTLSIFQVLRIYWILSMNSLS